MTERVRVELERLKKEYGDREYGLEAWYRIVRDDSSISWTTFRKYVKLEAHVYEVEEDSWEWEQGYDTYTEYSWK